MIKKINQFSIDIETQEKKRGKNFLTIMKQIKGSISKKYDLNKIIIAYEPVWSIGTGKIPKTLELKKIFKFIKIKFKKTFKTKKPPVVLYGGSVKANNAKEITGLPNVDGALIGGASLKPQEFSMIFAD